MLNTEMNDKLTQVGPGTPMGALMRRYWQPIAGRAELENGHNTKAIRLLGEDLVLFKDRSGNLGLVDWACAHRRMNLLFGIPEENGLRCAYHGWLYEPSGQCIETPAEAPDSTFKDRVRIKAYPVQEKGGLVFAYLGPAPAPLIPNWGPWVEENVLWDIGWAVVPCNWLQIMENSLDPVHTEWLHRVFSHYAMEQQGQLDEDNPNYWRAAPPVRPHVKIGFDVYDHGIVKRRVLEGGSEEDVSWRIGHPMVFPNMLHASQIRVPMDDTHTLYLWYSSHPMMEGDVPQKPEEVPVYKVPLPGVDEEGHPTWNLLDNNSGQDHAAWMTQGYVSNRSLEKLGESDRGIIMYRRLLNEQVKIVEDGGDPMNVIRDPAKNVALYVPDETEEGDMNWRGGSLQRTDGVSTGNSGKYSPIGRAQALKKGKPVADIPESAHRIVVTPDLAIHV